MSDEPDKLTTAKAPSAETPLHVAGNRDRAVGEHNSSKGYAWLTSAVWWHNAVLTALVGARLCFFPAVLWLVCNAVMVIGGWQSSARIGTSGELKPETIALALLMILTTLVLSLVLMGWSLSLWLSRLTAYARSFLQLPVDGAEKLDRATVLASQRQALAEMNERKTFMFKFWLYVTIFLAPSLFLVMLPVFVKMLMTPTVCQMFGITMPPWLNPVGMFVAGLQTIVLSEASLIALAVSAISQRPALAAAKDSLKLSVRYFAPGFALSILVLVINVVIASPQVLFQIVNHEDLFTLKADVAVLLLQNFWQSLTSIILWTLSAAPICQMVKGQID